jgi:hypothetical protein
VVKTAGLFSVLVGCAFVLVGALGCSRYDEEQSWRECCVLQIVDDRATSSMERRAIVSWASSPGFWGNGKSMDWVGAKDKRKEWIALSLISFHKSNPGARARDHFVGLGMACVPVGDPKTELARCDVELPIWVKCAVMMSWPFGATPVPKELQRPIPAVLQMTIDVSASAVLDTSVQVMPIPGGRLCHR